MEQKKDILLLTTGGTIASAPGGQGLEPRNSGVLQAGIDQLREHYNITVHDVMCLDSSNMQPEQWQQLARHIYEHRQGYDGIVVSHGTDTMAYTASAVTFMLPHIDLPVVFTGSQLPLHHILSDGPDNLRTAFAMAASGCRGIYLAFDRKVMRGCRAVKVRASGFSAFESVNARYAAQVSNRGLVIDQTIVTQEQGTTQLKDQLCQDVFLLKLTPGQNPDIFDALIQMGCKGIVIEAFGLGGINVLGSVLQKLQKAIDRGISIVITTQCLYDSSDLGVYQVGHELLKLGVIQGRDMTTEAALTKLMWALGQGMDAGQVSQLFQTSLAGEITTT